MPFNIIIEGNCDRSCSYCFARSFLSSKLNRITRNDFSFLINSLIDLKIFSVGITGGEPTLHPEFFSLLDDCFKLGIRPIVKSHGLWRNSVSEFFGNIAPDKMSFLIGLTDETLENSESIARLNKNIQSISNQNITLGVTILNDSLNIQNFESIIRSNNNITRVRWSFAHPIFLSERSSKFVKIEEYPNFKKLVFSILSLAKKCGIKSIGDHCIPVCLFSEEEWKKILALDGEMITNCRPSYDFLPDRSVLYCLPLINLVRTNFKDSNDLMKVVLYYESLSRSIRKTSLPFEKCKCCHYFIEDICDGGCFAHRKITLERYDLENFEKKVYQYFQLSKYVELVKKENSVFVLFNDNELKSKIYISLELFEFLQYFSTRNCLLQYIDENSDFPLGKIKLMFEQSCKMGFLSQDYD